MNESTRETPKTIGYKKLIAVCAHDKLTNNSRSYKLLYVDVNKSPSEAMEDFRKIYLESRVNYRFLRFEDM
jgi:hypothetical protein